MSGLMLTALKTAATAQAEVLTIMGAGVAASAYGLLPPTSLRIVAKLCLALLNPFLILSLNQSFSLNGLAKWSPVIVIAAVHIGLGAALGLVASRLLRLRSPQRELCVLTTAFGNCGALPFVLVLPVVRTWPVTRDDPTAHDTGLAVIGLCARP
jgi:predicted permease